MMRASVQKGSDGQFYIVPIRAGLPGVSWKTQDAAQEVADAINAAYEDGKEEIRASLRDLLRVPTVEYRTYGD